MFEILKGRESRLSPLVESYLQVSTDALVKSGIGKYALEGDGRVISAAGPNNPFNEDCFVGSLLYAVRSDDVPEESKVDYTLIKIDGSGRPATDAGTGLFSISHDTTVAVDKLGRVVDSKLVTTVLALSEIQRVMGLDRFFAVQPY